MNKLLATIITLAIGFCPSVFAQQNKIEVAARMDSTSIFIGEQTTLTIEANQPHDAHLQFPIFSDIITGKLELVETLTPDTSVISDGYIHVENNYKVTAFDSTLVYMPGFKVAYQSDTLITNPLTLKVLDMPVDTTQQAITDIKGIYKPPFDWIRLLTIIAICILAAAFIAGIVFVIYKLRKNKAEEKGPEPVIDPRSAYEIAVAELNELKEKGLWQAGHTKEYHSNLTDIIRRYIDRRFSINAMEQSSEDILYLFRSDKALRELKTEIGLLSSILQIADLVKFAKMTPLANDNERAMKDALQFVELTKAPEVQQASEDKEPEVSDNI